MAKGRTAHGEEMRSRLLSELHAHPQRPPTYKELAASLGIKPNAVRHHIDVLVGQGFVAREPRVSRSFRLTGKHKDP